ncbi:MAG: efflux RND transporter permease subunit [Bdellovibrionales bacterium]
MTSLYQSPLRVYLALGALALWGLFSGFQLPVSLFPNSSKPTVSVQMGYGDMSAQEFLNTYGRDFEGSLQGIDVAGTEVDKLTATYSPGYVLYKIEFKWGADPRKALREVQTVTASLTAQLSQEIRQSTEVETWNENSGFLAVSFYSQKRSLDELYKALEPILVAPAKRVKDAAMAELWNPARKEIRIELNPEKTALLQLFPRDVATAVLPQLTAYRGGSFVEGLNNLTIEMPPTVRSVEELKRAVIPTRSGRIVHLSDIANIEMGVPSNNSRSMKTSGVPSLILFAMPRAGGNIKRMAEDIMAIVNHAAPNLPKDIEFKVLVDPSEFIRSAVTNVVHEVVIAALLAVFVLFLFIGNIRNVVTAAIEIPLSIVLAFILMRMMGMNLNLISLGGLALSAGMNVDGSVVVMENIFRHFDAAPGPMSQREKIRLLGQAVSEVRFPIIASTIASLVVFIPLAFTSALTNAILGDLALAVVFSHGFSAIVALVLVPTVRLQLMSRSVEKSSHSFLEPVLRKIEDLYSRALGVFMSKATLKLAVYGALIAVLAALVTFVLPKLPREVIGKPDTDWLILAVNTRGNTLIRQMESLTETVESRMLDKFGSDIRYTFTQIQNPNRTSIMARLSDKSKMQALWKGFEAEFANTPEVQFFIIPWNPSELTIPDPPNLQISISGREQKDRIDTAREVYDLLLEKNIYPRFGALPELAMVDGSELLPSAEQWSILSAKGHLTPADLADVSRTATLGRRLWQMPIDGEMLPIQLGYPVNQISSLADLESLPIGVNGKLIPLKALAQLHRYPAQPDIYRENGEYKVLLTGRVAKGDEAQIPANMKQAKAVVAEWQEKAGLKHTSAVTFDDAEKELTEALLQLAVAVGLSIILIFITMVFQFGDIVNAILVLVAVPLGFIGVLISLFVFHSTLSLNSVLGVILLNGIAVANSIILVDFLKRLVDEGKTPYMAALEAAKKRLRPILMTSVCTGLGMLPVAMGFGEGGRILQPLGIAVVGGLSFSMLTTLFIVPSLQVSYLTWKMKRRGEKKLDEAWGKPPEATL